MAGELNEKQELFATRIGNSVDRISALITDLLDISKIEAGIDEQVKVVDLTGLASEVVAELQSQADRKHQQLVYHGPGCEIPVSGNEVRLKQVIQNLVNNAIKYTPDGGQISVIAQHYEKQVLLEVEDNGLGIPPAAMPFVFDKFFRVKDADRSEIEGTGLGLAICKSIIEKYGGRIWVQSQHHQGSTFAFTLPVESTPVGASSVPLETLSN